MFVFFLIFFLPGLRDREIVNAIAIMGQIKSAIAHDGERG